MIQQSFKILNELRHSTGLFSASNKAVSTGYDKAWLRDNIYEALGLEAIDILEAAKTVRALLDVMLKHEYKIDWAIKEKPKYKHQYIHARFHPETFEEFHDEWGNKQNDAVGAFLWKIADMTRKGIDIVGLNKNYQRILQKLVYYLGSIEYWHDADSGMWEENEEVHASSVGACFAALKLCKQIFVHIYVPDEFIAKGREALDSLLPRESETKETDLALLSLIYPYNIVSYEQKIMILKSVEEKLVREKGVVRYIGDKYYHRMGEAEWTFGFPWLAIIYRQENNYKMFMHYLQKTMEVMNSKGEMPELYYANSDEHNENCPLGWAQALAIIAMKGER
jgi:phosphorylase kinase alpha/beta subunit